MKRQLNFWSKMHGLPDKDLINTSLSIEDNTFTVRFGRPGSVEPIDQIVIELSNEEAIQLKHAFELAGANVFQDEMDEKIYYANIARSIDAAKTAENFSMSVTWAVFIFIIFLLITAVLIKLSLFVALYISIFVAIISGLVIKKKFYKDE